MIFQIVVFTHKYILLRFSWDLNDILEHVYVLYLEIRIIGYITCPSIEYQKIWDTC